MAILEGTPNLRGWIFITPPWVVGCEFSRQVMSGAAVEQQHKDWNSDDEETQPTVDGSEIRRSLTS